MEGHPLVSVLMTAYNREKYIAEAIESVLASTFTDFELIIVDDCSVDGSVKIAMHYEAKDSRIKVFINEKNLGDYPNRNKAASYANGTYLKYVDSDDTIFPHALEVMVSAMEKNPEAALGISSRYPDKPPVEEYYLLSAAEAYRTHFFNFGFLDNGPSFTIIKRIEFEVEGGFGLKRNVSDFEMWLKMAAKNKVLVLPGQLIKWRQHEGQEFLLAPECYLEHQFSILKRALDPANSPLTEPEGKALLKKYKKNTVTEIMKFSLKKKSIKDFIRLMRANEFGLSDLFVLFKKFMSKLSSIDFMRKGIYYLVRRRDINLIRKAKSLFYFKSTNLLLGKSVKIFGLPMDINIGKQVRIYDKCVLEFGAESIVSLGSNTIFSYGVVFCCRSSIKIGNDVQIGEYTSLRDTTHTYNDTSKPMREISDFAAPISIGNDVWIGRGCIIMPGTIIEDGVVVGANSVVKGLLRKNGIYAGAPCRLIKFR